MYAKKLDGTDFDYEIREAARFWRLTPGQLRGLPWAEQIEMMAHRREVNLRKAHMQQAGKEVGAELARKKEDEERGKGGRRPPGRG